MRARSLSNQGVFPHLTRPFSAPVQPYCWAIGINATDMFTCTGAARTRGESPREQHCVWLAQKKKTGWPDTANSGEPASGRTLSMLHSTNDAEVAATSIQRWGTPNTRGAASPLSSVSVP